ncbi:MAG TPA: vWA domain-containing protein [Vicinamibacteria bacterium]|nr:vWA domain-containing protein [Vicinamibacteria bacterium]
MRRRKRKTEVFGLSFMDCICCGFGATVLLYMILNSGQDRRAGEALGPLRSETNRLEEEVLEGQAGLVELRNTLERVRQEAAATQGLSTRLIEVVDESQHELATFEERTLASREHMNRLQADLRSLEAGAKRLSGGTPSREVPGEKVRAFVGDGDRQYLTGLKIGGRRILLLVDASASMLADTIVNAVRRRLLPEAERVRADKWRRAVRAADWLSAQLPRDAHFQLYVFDTEARPVVPGTEGRWLETRDRASLDAAIARLKGTAPGGGTSLESAFAAAAALSPPPDNILLLTDGLPTQGRTPPRGRTVSGKDRLKLFDRAVLALPRRVPVNTLLFPMEGDPMAAPAFWKLAMATGGAFLTPSRDWP